MTAEELFWDIATTLIEEDPRVAEGTIMGSRCLRANGEFLALVGYKESGLVVKLPKARVDALVAAGEGQPFGPGKKIFKEWVSIPTIDRPIWESLLAEGVEFVS